MDVTFTLPNGSIDKTSFLRGQLKDFHELEQRIISVNGEPFVSVEHCKWPPRKRKITVCVGNSAIVQRKRDEEIKMKQRRRKIEQKILDKKKEQNRKGPMFAAGHRGLFASTGEKKLCDICKHRAVYFPENLTLFSKRGSDSFRFTYERCKCPDEIEHECSHCRNWLGFSGTCSCEKEYANKKNPF